jgi:hypothetical protein
MKNWQLNIIGLLNGVYFVHIGVSQGASWPMTLGGVLVCLCVGNLIYMPLFSGAKYLARFAGTQGARVQSLFRLYQMAPQILENQRRLEGMASRMLLLDGRVDMWRKLAQTSIGKSVAAPIAHDMQAFSKFDEPFEETFNEPVTRAAKKQNKKSFKKSSAKSSDVKVAEVKPANKKIKVSMISHNEELDSGLDGIVAKSNSLQLKADEKALIVTDIGQSEVSLQTLSDYVIGDVELDFWIAKKIISGKDLLVLSPELFANESDIVLEAIEKLSNSYAMTYVLAQAAAIGALKDSSSPVAERVIESEIISI